MAVPIYTALVSPNLALPFLHLPTKCFSLVYNHFMESYDYDIYAFVNLVDYSINTHMVLLRENRPQTADRMGNHCKYKLLFFLLVVYCN